MDLNSSRTRRIVLTAAVGCMAVDAARFLVGLVTPANAQAQRTEKASQQVVGQVHVAASGDGIQITGIAQGHAITSAKLMPGRSYQIAVTDDGTLMIG